jgi:hypothetical protein
MDPYPSIIKPFLFCPTHPFSTQNLFFLYFYRTWHPEEEPQGRVYLLYAVTINRKFEFLRIASYRVSHISTHTPSYFQYITLSSCYHPILSISQSEPFSGRIGSFLTLLAPSHSRTLNITFNNSLLCVDNDVLRFRYLAVAFILKEKILITKLSISLSNFTRRLLLMLAQISTVSSNFN